MAPSRPGSGRTALFILGAPGGGVGVLADALRASGAAEVADPGALGAFNDRRLAALGSARGDVLGPRRGSDADAPSPADVEEAEGLLRSAEPDEPLLILRDPACTRLHGLWTSALESAGWRVGHVLLVRAPAGAAAELSADEGLTRNAGLLLWTSYMLEAERAARGARRRATVAYDRLLADPETELDRIERALGQRLPRRTWDSAAEIEAALRTAPRTAAAPAPPEALAPVDAFADHLSAAARDEPGNADVAAETARWFIALADLMAPVMRRGAATTGPAPEGDVVRSDAEALERLRREAREAGVRAETAEARADVLQSALAVARRRSAEAEALLQARATQASAGERDARTALAAALSARDLVEEERDSARTALEEGRRDLEAAEGRLVDAETRLRGASELVDALESEIEDERVRHGEARDRLALLGVSNHAAQTRVRELQAQLDETRDELERRRRWLPRLFGLR